ncbi:MAG: oxaloacetate-decarboxylating malate dehydrogenase, partial [Mycobacterium sp.]
PRVRDQRYDDLIESYVTIVSELFPGAMLHWEDFGASNARRSLNKYADQVCTFNDDMQGTGAVVLAAVSSAVRAVGSRVIDQRIVIHGAGTAGLGIADMIRDRMIHDGLSQLEATSRFYAVSSKGLLLADVPGLRDFQRPYAREREEVRDWAPGADVRRIELADVVAHAHPTILIGTSTQAGAFTESIVKDMAAHTERPIIMPLSNPTSKAEAVPADLIAWTNGRVLTATGSPFSPVVHEGRTHQVAQANNALVFPGIGLGVAVVKATRISDRMIAAAAEAVARLSDATTSGGALLPPMTDLRFVSAAVALAVANAAVEQGFARVELHDPIEQVQQAMWHPEYPRIVP